MDEKSLFTWLQPNSTYQACELIDNNNNVIATLQWEEQGVIGNYLDLRVVFRQTGIIRTTVITQETNSSEIKAIYKAGWDSSGVFKKAQGGGSKFLWRKLKSNEWSWMNDRKEIIIIFKVKIDSQNKTGKIEVASHFFELSEAKLLLLLGWYLVMINLGGGYPTGVVIPYGTPGQ